MKFLSAAASIWIALASGMTISVSVVGSVSYFNNYWEDFSYILHSHASSHRMNPINVGDCLTSPVAPTARWCFRVSLSWLDYYLMDCHRIWYREEIRNGPGGPPPFLRTIRFTFQQTCLNNCPYPPKWCCLNISMLALCDHVGITLAIKLTAASDISEIQQEHKKKHIYKIIEGHLGKCRELEVGACITWGNSQTSCPLLHLCSPCRFFFQYYNIWWWQGDT